MYRGIPLYAPARDLGIRHRYRYAPVRTSAQGLGRSLCGNHQGCGVAAKKETEMEQNQGQGGQNQGNLGQTGAADENPNNDPNLPGYDPSLPANQPVDPSQRQKGQRDQNR